MHEYSIMGQMVDALLEEVQKHSVKKIGKVFLELGELTFLAPEQLKFAYELLTTDNVLKGSELVIAQKPAKMKCEACSYVGKLAYQDAPEYHYITPIFSCPKCGGGITIIEGRECVITRVVGEVCNH